MQCMQPVKCPAHSCLEKAGLQRKLHLWSCPTSVLLQLRHSCGEIFIIQSSWLKLGFPRPGWPEEIKPVLAIFLHTSSLFLWAYPKGWKTVDIKSHLDYMGFYIKSMYKPLHCADPKSCSDTSRAPSKDEIWEESSRRASNCRICRSGSFCLSWSSLILSAFVMMLPLCSIPPSKDPCARTDGFCGQQLSY